MKITVSKSRFPPVLAQRWKKDFGARPDMSIKVGRSSTICEYRGGLRECEARSNPYVIRDRTAVARTAPLHFKQVTYGRLIGKEKKTDL